MNPASQRVKGWGRSNGRFVVRVKNQALLKTAEFIMD